MAGKEIARIARLIISLAFIVLIISTDTWFPDRPVDAIRRYTRPLEFDYISWEIKAIWNKASNLSFDAAHHLTPLQQETIGKTYFELLSQSRKIEKEITTRYSDPAISDINAIEKLEHNLELVNTRLRHQAMLAEPVFQYQISQAIAVLDITKIATPFPPVLFRATPLPTQLIISPRDTIRQERSVSLQPDISLKEMIALEDLVEKNSDFSALVVPIGGVGTYPSMIIETTYLPNLLDTAAHEWTHNHLTFRPLGLRYNTSPALRTMNETTANIAGDEIMRQVLRMFYPEFYENVIPPKTNLSARNNNLPANSEIGFNFSEEMYLTRVRVDELLSQGEIEEAESYMEEQRQIFWKNGYQIRKLNQAYFSFYGAYADSPFSAAGKDPVGEDVRLFRAQQPDLSSFIWKMSWMLNYRQLRFAARAF